MSASENDGLRRLAADLATPPAPVRLQGRVLSRIASEPARLETDWEGRIVSINPAFTALCGYAFAEIKGRKPGAFLQGAQTDPAAVADLRDAVKKGISCTVEMINYHKNGSAYLVRISMEPVHSEEARLLGFRAVEIQLPQGEKSPL